MELVAAAIAAYLIYILQKYLYRKFWDKNLSVELHLSKDTVVVGEELTLVETITNRKLLPLPLLKVKFRTSRYFAFPDLENANITDNYYRSDILSLMMYQRLTRQLPFQVKHRGYFIVDRADVICSNLFISTEMVKNWSQNISLYVYPKLLDVPDLDALFKNLLGMVLTKRFTNEDPFEFRGIREYQPYDALKSINWKASSKTGDLQVNAYNYTSSFQVKILLNLEQGTTLRQEGLEEESISLAASLSMRFLAQGIPVSFHTNCLTIRGEACEIIKPGSGIHHMDAINKVLSLLDTNKKSFPFVDYMENECLTGTNDYAIFISTYQKEDYQSLLCRMAAAKIDFHWIFPKNNDITAIIFDELKANTIIWSQI
ncbi:DUF58 domain-containing protein [Anaerocolumna sp. AGMB13020]|uniref:DUF58 domain-containing protein n=1 Tax=Anaerocolumna sp. AGMB13020 TaxID=3081750 RepID=UPI002955D2C6|nr:DUF58 domain-containing protein [Anaerocolumna sp. AGMB13020]WOO35235.1 DUF58 domain-containing protein [Anaerocolumna sp. AGMB13020]